MQLWIYPVSKEAVLTRIPMQHVSEAYFKGGEFHPGYMVPEDDWDSWMESGGEYIASAMYEGHEHFGKYRDVDTNEILWYWLVLPDSLDEWVHLEEVVMLKAPNE